MDAEELFEIRDECWSEYHKWVSREARNRGPKTEILVGPGHYWAAAEKVISCLAKDKEVWQLDRRLVTFRPPNDWIPINRALLRDIISRHCTFVNEKGKSISVPSMTLNGVATWKDYPGIRIAWTKNLSRTGFYSTTESKKHHVFVHIIKELKILSNDQNRISWQNDCHFDDEGNIKSPKIRLPQPTDSLVSKIISCLANDDEVWNYYGRLAFFDSPNYWMRIPKTTLRSIIARNCVFLNREGFIIYPHEWIAKAVSESWDYPGIREAVIF